MLFMVLGVFMLDGWLDISVESRLWRRRASKKAMFLSDPYNLSRMWKRTSADDVHNNDSDKVQVYS